MVEIAANAAKTMTTIDCASLAQPAKAAENPAIMAISATFDATLAQAKAATAEVSEGAIAPGKTLPPIAARQPLAAFIAKGGSLQRHDAAAPEQTEATHGDAALQDTVQAPAELPLAGEAAARLASLIVAQPISQPAPAQSAAPRPAPATTTAGQTSAPVAIPARSVPAPRQAAPQREPGLAFIHVPGGLLLEMPADSPPPPLFRPLRPGGARARYHSRRRHNRCRRRRSTATPAGRCSSVTGAGSTGCIHRARCHGGAPGGARRQRPERRDRQWRNTSATGRAGRRSRQSCRGQRPPRHDAGACTRASASACRADPDSR